jgi:hypothetical protein
MLKTETCTPAMERRVLRAFLDFMDFDPANARQCSVDFEHGQWWATYKPTGAVWSVVDVEGPSAIDGFGFEQLTQGEED